MASRTPVNVEPVCINSDVLQETDAVAYAADHAGDSGSITLPLPSPSRAQAELETSTKKDLSDHFPELSQPAALSSDPSPASVPAQRPSSSSWKKEDG